MTRTKAREREGFSHQDFNLVRKIWADPKRRCRKGDPKWIPTNPDRLYMLTELYDNQRIQAILMGEERYCDIIDEDTIMTNIIAISVNIPGILSL